MRVFLTFCGFLRGALSMGTLSVLFMGGMLALMAAPEVRAQAFVASGNTVSLAVTGTTGRVAVPSDNYNNAVRVYNAGTVAVFIACGDVTVTATLAAGMPVAPGSVEVLGCGKGYIAGIVTTGTATLYLTPGAGI